MTHRPPVGLVSGFVFVVLLCSCATDTAVDPAAAASAQGQGSTSSSSDASTDSVDSTGNGGTDRGNPGGPGGSGDDTGTDGTDVQAGGNPGAPGDVAVFEEAGVPFGVLRDDAATTCADGVCTLLEPVPTVGNPDDVGGLDECIIQKQSDIHYEPPAQDGLFQKGATVQADVDCTTDDSTTLGGDGSDTSGSDSSASASATAEPQE
jgi:hypothetical protein